MKRLLYTILLLVTVLSLSAQTHGTFKIVSSQKFHESTFQYDEDGNIYNLNLCENGETVFTKLNPCGTLLWSKRIDAIDNEKERLVGSESWNLTFIGEYIYVVTRQIYLNNFRSNTKKLIHCFTTDGTLKWSRLFPITFNGRLSPHLNGFVDADGHLVLAFYRTTMNVVVDSVYFNIIRLNNQNGEILNQNTWTEINYTGGFVSAAVRVINIYENSNEIEFLRTTKNYELEKTVVRLDDLSLVGHYSQTRYKQYTYFNYAQYRVGNKYKLVSGTEQNLNIQRLLEVYGRFDTVIIYKPIFGGSGNESCAITIANDSLVWINSLGEYPNAYLEGYVKGNRLNYRVALDEFYGARGHWNKRDVHKTSFVFSQYKHASNFKRNQWFDIVDYESGYCKDKLSPKWNFEIEDSIIIDWKREVLQPAPRIFLKDTTFTVADSDFEVRKICGSNDWLPSKYLPNDTVVCKESFELKADSVPSNANVHWSTGDTSETITIETSGFYFVTVSNGSCQVTDSIHVQFIKNPLALKRNRFYKCERDSFELMVNDFEYFNLIEGDDTLFGNANLSAVWLTQQGNFKLETKPEHQCPKAFEFSLSNSSPKIELPIDTLLCNKMDLQLEVSNEYDSYLFLNGQISDSLKSEYALQSTTDSMVSILIVDSIGCTAADTMLVREHKKLQIDFSYDSQFTCRSDSFKLSINSVQGKPPFVIEINDTSLVLDSNNYELQNAIGKVYQIAVKDACNRSMAIPTIDTKAKRLKLQAHFSGADTLLLGSTFSAFATVDNGAFYWYLNEVAQHSNERFTHLPADTGIYDLTVKGEYLNCSDSASKTYYVTTPFLFVPNAFTVNNDGLNEHWQPICYKCEIEGYKIFNRWGQLIFESDGNTAWDGTFKGENVPLGVYQALISYKDETGGLHTKSVAIYLLK